MDELTVAREELARLHEGEEAYEDERAAPTAAQWIWLWNQASPAKRLQVAEQVIQRQQQGQADYYRQQLKAAEGELAEWRQRAAARQTDTCHLAGANPSAEVPS